MQMTGIIINGCGGRMGKALASQSAEKGIKVLCGVDIFPAEASFPVYTSLKDIDTPAGVVIDFTTASALEQVLEFGIKNNIPLVLATTGYTAEQREKILEASKKIPIFNSGNMSVGVSVTARAAAAVAAQMGEDFDIEIIETHHSAKLDAPSGTALMLADEITNELGEREYVFERASRREKRPKKEIGIHSVRGGGVIGEHTVMIIGQHETISVTHRAHDRGLFAYGAIRAAEFVSNKQNGFYTMKDLIISEVK